MWFWIFMFIMVLMIPGIMILCGWFFWKKPPQKINGMYGYRTSRSMKNKDTCRFAHLNFGKLWFFIGWILLVISVFAMLVVVGQGIDCVGTVGGILASVQCVVMIVPIIPTERALKRRFNF